MPARRSLALRRPPAPDPRPWPFPSGRATAFPRFGACLGCSMAGVRGCAEWRRCGSASCAGMQRRLWMREFAQGRTTLRRSKCHGEAGNVGRHGITGAPVRPQDAGNESRRGEGAASWSGERVAGDEPGRYSSRTPTQKGRSRRLNCTSESQIPLSDPIFWVAVQTGGRPDGWGTGRPAGSSGPGLRGLGAAVPGAAGPVT